MTILYVVLGIVAGYFAGFLGIGAGVLLMPALTFLGIPYHVAVDASLIAVFLSSLTSSIHHYRIAHIPLAPAVTAGTMGVIFSCLGNLYLVDQVPTAILQIIFAALMFFNVDLIRLLNNKHSILVDINYIDHKKNFFRYIVIGALSGLMASMLGIGGGIVIVSLLCLWASYDSKSAVRISVIIMTVTTFASLCFDAYFGELPFDIGIPTALGAVIGSFLGTIALKYISPDIIRKTNYFISYLLGVSMLIQIAIN